MIAQLEISPILVLSFRPFPASAFLPPPFSVGFCHFVVLYCFHSYCHRLPLY
ncbi:hypothetical protein BCR44DRAFT_1432303 [Catenaria anguillulae PL171]|uniref:Uncharacterized protein n=1 Tax=Catenaria anguillulae PL171 TaxID=765915 RepID=A0A1Y2HQ29_9FUNG|nr:hypothetical protein BCR44DRAFT_1432303 [Catenaria anguillulae PL171]